MENDYLKQLITQIKSELEEEHSNFFDTNNMINREALLPYAQWTNRPYSRVCLFENTDFELILICWNPQAQTRIHDHDNQNCRVFFFDGPFKETIYCSNGEQVLLTQNIAAGSTTRMKAGQLCHSLKNLSDHSVMTLHLYNAPIKSCRVRNSTNDHPMESTKMINDFVVEYTN